MKIHILTFSDIDGHQVARAFVDARAMMLAADSVRWHQMWTVELEGYQHTKKTVKSFPAVK